MSTFVLSFWVRLVAAMGFWGAVIVCAYALLLVAALGLLIRTAAVLALKGIRRHRVRRFMRLHNGGRHIQGDQRVR